MKFECPTNLDTHICCHHRIDFKYNLCFVNYRLLVIPVVRMDVKA